MYREVFKNKHTVLPVIHAEDYNQVYRNVRIALNSGADGVFLINHSISGQELLKIHEEINKQISDFWMGVNILGEDPSDIFSLVNSNVSGIWVDNAGIDEKQLEQDIADEHEKNRELSGYKGLYFGGVAFKYQKPVKDLESVAKIATQYMDVVTTSGPGTGKAADIEKIKSMKLSIGSFPLAITSGITPDNIDEYLEYIDCFLVATGISDSFTELNPVKLRNLIKKIN